MESEHRLTFPQVPRGWYYVCSASRLRRGPVGFELGSRKFVAFCDARGEPAVIDARCSHMGADLSRGCVIDGIVHCPLHDWQYDRTGRCVRIPASDEIPPFGQQASYPATEIGGHIVVFNSPDAAPDHPMPFYDGVTPADLWPARPFELIVDTPWYIVGANGFDLQHFRVAHDRTLLDTPVIESPSPFARRVTANFEVAGSGFREELTRRFSGPRVRMSVTVWWGTNILVTAEFRRTTSYGMVFVRPLGPNRTHLRAIVWVPRRSGALAHAMINPLDAWIRSRFIRAFMLDDALRAAGVRYNPATLIAADAEMVDYLAWLAALTGATTDSTEADTLTTRSS